MKYLMISLMLLLVSCTRETSEITTEYQFPAELSDCKVYSMNSESGNRLNVVRCPLSNTSTTYHVGKTTATTIVTEVGTADTFGLGEYKQLSSKFSDTSEYGKFKILSNKFGK